MGASVAGRVLVGWSPWGRLAAGLAPRRAVAHSRRLDAACPPRSVGSGWVPPPARRWSGSATVVGFRPPPELAARHRLPVVGFASAWMAAAHLRGSPSSGGPVAATLAMELWSPPLARGRLRQRPGCRPLALVGRSCGSRAHRSTSPRAVVCRKPLGWACTPLVCRLGSRPWTHLRQRSASPAPWWPCAPLGLSPRVVDATGRVPRAVVCSAALGERRTLSPALAQLPQPLGLSPCQPTAVRMPLRLGPPLRSRCGLQSPVCPVPDRRLRRPLPSPQPRCAPAAGTRLCVKMILLQANTHIRTLVLSRGWPVESCHGEGGDMVTSHQRSQRSAGTAAPLPAPQSFGPAEAVSVGSRRVAAAFAEPGSTRSRDQWLGVVGDCQALINTLTAVQDEAIAQAARRESTWCEDGTLGETVHAPGRVTLDAADLVAPVIGASHAVAQRRVEQAVRLAAGRAPDPAERQGPAPTQRSGWAAPGHGRRAARRLPRRRHRVRARGRTRRRRRRHRRPPSTPTSRTTRPPCADAPGCCSNASPPTWSANAPRRPAPTPGYADGSPNPASTNGTAPSPARTPPPPGPPSTSSPTTWSPPAPAPTSSRPAARPSPTWSPATPPSTSRSTSPSPPPPPQPPTVPRPTPPPTRPLR